MKKIEINDREVFERYHVNSIINSEYQFSTLFIWQHAHALHSSGTYLLNNNLCQK